MSFYRSIFVGLFCAIVAGMFSQTVSAEPANATKFLVSFAKERSAQPLDGRILLLLSTDGSAEPRMQISISYKTQMVFGVDVEKLEGGKTVAVDDAAFGYPVRYLRDVPAGEYFVQAVLNRYETFHRSDGHTVKLHMDQGEGQHWNISPGNFYSKPQKITVGGNAQPIVIVMDQEIPPIENDRRPHFFFQHREIDVAKFIPVRGDDQCFGINNRFESRRGKFRIGDRLDGARLLHSFGIIGDNMRAFAQQLFHHLNCNR